MWLFEIEVQTSDPDVRSRIADDLAAWEGLRNISLSVARTEIGPAGGRVVRSESLASLTLRPAPAGPVAEPGRRRPPPVYATVAELPQVVPFPVFAIAGFGGPHERALVSRDSHEPDAATTVTIAYPVMDGNWHAGNVWLKLSDRPFPVSPAEMWADQDGVSVCEDHTPHHYRYKVRLERDGTYIHLESAVHGSLDDVLALVDRLQRIT